MRAEGRWGVGRSSLTTQGQTGQKSSGRTTGRRRAAPAQSLGGCAETSGPPGQGRHRLGRPAGQGSQARALRLPPPLSLWARGVTGPRQLQLSHKAAAGEQVTPSVRRGLARGTSVDQPQGGPAWLSHAVPRHLWMESAGWQAPRSGPGWKGLGYRRRHRDRGSQDTWHKAGSHHTLSVGSCRGHMRPHLASVPGVRRAELFTQDSASSVVAEEGRRYDTGPPCP